MQFSIPIYRSRAQWGEVVWHTVGLGEFNQVSRGRSEMRIESQIINALRREIRKCPPSRLDQFVLSRGLQFERVQLELSLRSAGKRRKFSGVFPIIIEPRWANLEERMMVAYHPLDQHRWFPYDSSRPLEEQATAYWQRAWADVSDWQIREFMTDSKDSLKIISFNSSIAQLLDRIKKRKDTLYGNFALAGGGARKGSLSILHQVGTNLTPLGARGNLETGMPREPYRSQLSQLLAGKKKTSALLVGPSGSGKSTLVRQLVVDMLEADDYTSHRNLDRVWNVWQLSGRRLIAGMSYVGEWEERCVELLEAARKSQVVLWIDDLHAWGRIGQSRQSERALADLFRGPIARGELLVVGECTRAQLQQLEEDAPGLAGVLGKIFVEATDAPETMRMLLYESRKLEVGSNVRFSPLAFRTIIDVGGGLISAQSMPGKSLELMRALARDVSEDAPEVTPSEVVSLLSSRTGVPSLLLEHERIIDPVVLRKDLERQVIGQDEAVDAMVDLVLKIKSSLTGNRRPWGVYLFTGPTGTGKTEMAKTLAAYLYGDESRLVRFDMSEYATPDAPSRLIGDRYRPEGVLTAQVRQQPFCVVLFDEIEKAHPSVLNLMLQMFDEGRLTDAAGNEADFRHAVIVMTSNLGASQNATMGFGEDSSAHLHDQMRAVQNFFAPEIFNRIDSVVRFGPLNMQVARIIAKKELAKLMARRGLTERDVFIRMSRTVVDMVAREGFDARDGARSLKRYLERNVAGLLAEEIVARPGNDMRVMRLWRDRRTGDLDLQGDTLREADLMAEASRLEPLLERNVEELEAQLPDAIDFLDELADSDELATLSSTLREHLSEYQVVTDDGEADDAFDEDGLGGIADQIYNLELMRVKLRDFRDKLREYYEAFVEDDIAWRTEMEVMTDLAPFDYSDAKDGWNIQAPEPRHKRRLMRRQDAHPDIQRMNQEQLLEQLAEVYFLRRALSRVHDPTRHAIFVEIFRVGQVHKRKRFGDVRSGFVEQFARAIGMERGEVEQWALINSGGSVSSKGPDRDSLLSALDEHEPAHVVLRLVGLCIRDVFEGDDGAHVRLSLGTTPEIVRVKVSHADPEITAMELIERHLAEREAYEEALETGASLPRDPDAIGRLVRRLRFDLPEDERAFTIEIEDYGLAWTSRRHVRQLRQALHPMWMLRMGSMDESLFAQTVNKEEE